MLRGQRRRQKRFRCRRQVILQFLQGLAGIRRLVRIFLLENNRLA